MKDYKFFKHFARPKEEGDEDGNCCTAKPIESTRIIYDGPNLPCTGIRTCDDITIALQKIDVQICDLINQLYNLTSTTTTSTTTILPSTTTTTTTTAISLELRLTWDDIVNVPVVDINSVSNWNTFFNLPISGIPFSTVTIDVEENIVTLTGGININLRDSIFNGNHHLISIQDEGCIITTMFDCFIACTSIISVDMPSCITTGPACFYGCTNLTDANLPALITATDNLFTMCTSLTSISLPSLITAGPASFIGCTNSL